jgi:hypothetical protein
LLSRSSGRYAVAAALILAIGIPSVAVGFGEGRDTRLGKRNPSRSSLSSETQIIASNGSYGTRQSNKRDGDGGGAIYGCRSSAGREPCIRSNNLKGGRAFEFQTVGGSAGEIQVGDTKAPPFTTNATGKVENLNADTVDGVDSSQLAQGALLFAAVNADGALAAGKGATTSAKAGGNNYTVTFDRDVSKCSFTANVTGADPSVFGIASEPVAGQPTQVVFHQPADAGPGGAGRSFHAQVIC